MVQQFLCTDTYTLLTICYSFFFSNYLKTLSYFINPEKTLCIVSLKVLRPAAMFPQTSLFSMLLSSSSFPSCCSLVAKSCLTFWNPMDCSLPSSYIHGISLARILDWVTISSSRESSWPRDQICIIPEPLGKSILSLSDLNNSHSFSFPQNKMINIFISQTVLSSKMSEIQSKLSWIDHLKLYIFFKDFFLYGPFLKSLSNLLAILHQFYVSFFWLQGMWNLKVPQPEIKPAPPALEGEKLTTRLPGKSQTLQFLSASITILPNAAPPPALFISPNERT